MTLNMKEQTTKYLISIYSVKKKEAGQEDTVTETGVSQVGGRDEMTHTAAREESKWPFLFTY